MASIDADELLQRLLEVLAQKKMRASDLFRKIDTSGDGSLEADELRAGFADLGFKMNDEEFSVIMPKFDKDGGGDVSLREFERAIKMAEKLPPRKKVEEVKEEKPVKKKKQGLTNEDKEEFRQIFCLFKQLCRQELDEEGREIPLVEWDDSGAISVDELEQLLETVGMKMTSTELHTMIGELDQNGDGEINFQEFYDKMSQRVQVPHSPADIEKAFKAFAKNAPEGYIRSDHLKDALKTYLHKEHTAADIDELMNYYRDCFVKIPGHKGDYFQYQEYIEIMMPPAGAADGSAAAAAQSGE
eukprot:TRINITY_DN21725_c0_g1_i1.p1 TRINITY_DN21725_c0_g1~~TRINITY_DN21725_c0_g1_i1.p1  ORF type:complete len:300 (-),score=109.75 TRINITY_DN21725_c0_g1_i1:86-985(-)